MIGRKRDSRTADRGRSRRQGGHGSVRDLRGQEQPIDRERAQQTSAQKAQQDAAQDRPPSPGQPARGE
jgi:hypothetical protein